MDLKYLKKQQLQEKEIKCTEMWTYIRLSF